MMVSFMRCLKSKRALNLLIFLFPIFLLSSYSCSPKTDEKISRITADNVKLVQDSANLVLTGDVSVELENTLIEALKKAFNTEKREFKYSKI